MDSRLSNALEIVARLRESARRGDWKTAAEIATTLPRQTLPDSRDQVDEYLRQLTEALTVAKASRAHTAASLFRVEVAAKFHRAGGMAAELAAERQNVGDSAGS